MPLKLFVFGILGTIGVLSDVPQRCKRNVVRPLITREQPLQRADGLARIMTFAEAPASLQLVPQKSAPSSATLKPITYAIREIRID